MSVIYVGPDYIREEEAKPRADVNRYWLGGFVAGAVWALIMAAILWMLSEAL